MITEPGHVGLVHQVKVAHVAKEDRGLNHIRKRCALRRQECLHVEKGLGCLFDNTAHNHLAIHHAELTGNHKEVSGSNNGRVRTNRCTHELTVSHEHC